MFTVLMDRTGPDTVTKTSEFADYPYLVIEMRSVDEVVSAKVGVEVEIIKTAKQLAATKVELPVIIGKDWQKFVIRIPRVSSELAAVSDGAIRTLDIVPRIVFNGQGPQRIRIRQISFTFDPPSTSPSTVGTP
jgi:hypothetical protein